MEQKIIIKGARSHNLKNIDVEIPRNSLTVITGPSGSGKSSKLKLHKVKTEAVVYSEALQTQNG